MKYKAIIFDMDGTVVQSENFWIESTKKLLGRRNITLSEPKLTYIKSHFSGIGLFASCNFLKEHFDLVDSVEVLMQEKKEHAHLLYVQNVRFIHGFVEFHNMLQALDKKTALATNAGRQTVEITNKKLNLEQFFGKHLYTVTDIGKSKPHPAIYLHAAHQLELHPADCIAIEDSAHGIQAAKSAGMVCIGINTAGNKERLKDADLIVDQYEHINLKKVL